MQDLMTVIFKHLPAALPPYTLHINTNMILETLLNHYIDLDPDIKSTLHFWRGKSLKIVLTDLGQTFYLTIEDNKLALSKQEKTSPTTTLSGSSLSFLHLALADLATTRQLMHTEIQLEGDTEFAEALKNTIDALHIDWEEQLSKITGDVVAHQFFQHVHHTQDWFLSLKNSAVSDMGDYLKEESRLLPTQTQFHTFSKEIDTLTVDCDRLIARVDRLKKNKS